MYIAIFSFSFFFFWNGNRNFDDSVCNCVIRSELEIECWWHPVTDRWNYRSLAPDWAAVSGEPEAAWVMISGLKEARLSYWLTGSNFRQLVSDLFDWVFLAFAFFTPEWINQRVSSALGHLFSVVLPGKYFVWFLPRGRGKTFRVISRFPWLRYISVPVFSGLETGIANGACK